MDSLTGMWVNFFTAAGIPSDVGATYAITFTENRIQNDMLLDLNKEYLRDMGISRMGDVIAILRHAKSVHESAARERVLSTAAGPRVPVAAVAARLPAAHSKPSSPVTRMLERYTRNVSQTELQETPPVNLKRRMTEASGSSTDEKKPRHIEITTAAPARPSAGTASKKNVFSRLGGTAEPETTETPTNEVDAVSRTIFSRLGNKNLTVNVDDTQRSVKREQVRGEALEYEGILKSQPEVKKVVINMAPPSAVTRKTVSLGTMRADQAPVSVKEKLALPKVKSVKFSNHIDYKEIEPIPKKRIIFQSVTTDTLKPLRDDTPVFNKPERRLSMPSELNAAEVKSRLGTKTNLQRNVFTRLGGP